MEFQQAKDSHKDELLAMMKEFYLVQDYTFNQERAAETYDQFVQNDQLGKAWLISHGQQIIGYLIFTYGFSFEYGGKDAFIDEFYIKEEYRNQGYGTMILETLDFLAKKESVKAIHLEVERMNINANKLYAKSGYRSNDRSLLTKIID